MLGGDTLLSSGINTGGVAANWNSTIRTSGNAVFLDVSGNTGTNIMWTVDFELVENGAF